MTEPPTPKEAVARATAIKPLLIEQQAETEARTYYSEEIHQALLDAELYRLLVPSMFGGYEFDFPDFLRVVIELASGCMSAAWCYTLATGHALQAAALFDEQAQSEIFADPDFRCPAVAAPSGQATRTGDGWELNSTHAYSSGIPYATHYMGQTFAAGSGGDGKPPTILLFVAPRGTWTMLDDWGDTLGLKGSGSHSVKFDHARIPSRYVLENAWLVDTNVAGGTPGLTLHGNPLYAGRTLSFFQTELAALMIGGLKGALVEYEAIMTTRKTQRPPIVSRHLDPDYQRWFGLALGQAAAAEAMLLQGATQYMELCHRIVDEGRPFTREDDLRLNIVAREALRLAWETMHGQLFKTAGTSAAKDGERMQRIYRDMSMDWGHFGTLAGDWAARELAKEHLGLQVDPPPRPEQER
jgi:3-hydroxy-9,10-secoandrosta-1,3,5(10)-triene-9,17-dione monooxygenase